LKNGGNYLSCSNSNGNAYAFELLPVNVNLFGEKNLLQVNFDPTVNYTTMHWSFSIQNIDVSQRLSLINESISHLLCGSFCNYPNQGRCVSGLCSCITGYFGTFCQSFNCSSGCGSGVCVGPNSCNCSNGSIGSTCSDSFDCSGISSNDCNSPQGSCIGLNTCNCTNGYSGTNCTSFTCANNCNSPNGQCVGPNSCTCNSGYSGSDCSSQYNCNNVSNCSNNGNCIGLNNCQCYLGFEGADCSVQSQNIIITPSSNGSTTVSNQSVTLNDVNLSIVSGGSLEVMGNLNTSGSSLNITLNSNKVPLVITGCLNVTNTSINVNAASNLTGIQTVMTYNCLTGSFGAIKVNGLTTCTGYSVLKNKSSLQISFIDICTGFFTPQIIEYAIIGGAALVVIIIIIVIIVCCCCCKKKNQLRPKKISKDRRIEMKNSVSQPKLNNNVNDPNQPGNPNPPDNNQPENNNPPPVNNNIPTPPPLPM